MSEIYEIYLHNRWNNNPLHNRAIFTSENLDQVKDIVQRLNDYDYYGQTQFYNYRTGINKLPKVD